MAADDDNFGDPDTDEAIAERLTAHARKYFSTEFENPRRVNCPETRDLKAAALSSGIPPRSITDHVLGCSPCFADFKQFRSEQSISAPYSASAESRRRFRLPIAAFAAIASVFAVAICFTLWNIPEQNSTAKKRKYKNSLRQPHFE